MGKQKKKAKKKDNISQEPGMIKRFFTNENTHFITGLILSILTVYVAIAMFSFFFTGAADQSRIENIPLSELSTVKYSIQNWAGVRGAYISEVLINQWFGISSFILLFISGSIGLRLMRFIKGNMLKRTTLSLAFLVWGSIFFAFVFVKGYEDTFFYLGGWHGYLLSEFFTNNIGIPGLLLLLLGIFIILMVFANKHTVPFLQKTFTRNKGTEDLDEDLEEEIILTTATSLDDDEDSVESDEGKKKKNSFFQKLKRKKKEPEENIEENETNEEDSTEANEFVVTIANEEEAYKEPTKEKNNIKPVETEVADTSFSVDIPKDDNTPYDLSSLGQYDPRLDLSRYVFPSVDLLKKYDFGEHQVDMSEQTANQRRIKQTLENFGIGISSIKATVGPTITLYEVIPDAGVRISKIRNLEDDIALSLSALGIRIIAPMPGKGTIGIEVPNKDPQIVSMQSVIVSKKFVECKYDLPVALGKTITNENFMFDLCKMPHLLVAGATGQGKSVGLNAIITSLLYKKHPAELKFVLIDPKMVEFSIYSEIERHYLAKLPDEDKAIVTDFTKVIQVLNSLCKEMDDRYDLLMKAHTRNIKEYNTKFINRTLNPEKGHRFMPYIVVIIDEFGDLIMTAGKEIELPIARIAQKARAVGMHMVIATQRPSTNIITGTIKANFPARVAFRVSSMIDSRTILDSPGANQLIGRGDLLFSQGNDMTRVQCAFVDTPEVERICSSIGQQVGYPTAFLLPEYVAENENIPGAVDLSDRDALFDDAARLIVIQQQGSTSLIQRKFAIGYNRAGRLMDQLEAAGVVGPFEGSKARQVLIQDEYSLEQLLNSLR